MFPFAPPLWTPPSGGGSHDTTITAWMNQVVTNGGAVSAGRRTAWDTYAAGGKADGWWQKLDYLAVIAGENAQQELLDIIGLRTLTIHGSPTRTTDRGYAGDGVSAYIDTGFNPATMGVNYTQNSASFGGYNRTARTVGTVDMGMMGQTNAFFYPMKGSGQNQSTINANVGGSPDLATGTTSQGMWLLNRASSTAVTIRLRAAAFSSFTRTSQALVSENFMALASNFSSVGGGVLDFSTDQLAVIFFGASLTTTQSDAFYNRTQTFATTVGFNV